MKNTEYMIFVTNDEAEQSWWKRNKNRIIMGGAIVLGAVGACFLVDALPTIGSCLRRKASQVPCSLSNQIGQVSKSTESLVEPIIVHETPKLGRAINVSQHIRNLSGGKLPSSEKVATALEHNFVLGEHQTWVETYTKNQMGA